MSKAKVVLPIISGLFLVNSAFAAFTGSDIELDPKIRAAEEQVMRAKKAGGAPASAVSLTVAPESSIALDPRVRAAEESVLRLKKVDRATFEANRKAYDAKLSEGMARAGGSRFDYLDRYNP